MATVGDGWKRSSACSSHTCIEVKRVSDDLFWLMRSDSIWFPPTPYSRAEIDAFVKGWLAGEFDDLAAP